MRNVSLDAYTEKSRKYIAATGSTTVSFKAYNFPELPAKVELATPTERSGFLETQKVALDALYSSPDFGRWIWGDYTILSYTWGDASKTRHIKINGHLIEVTTNLEDFLRGYVLADNDGSEERMGIWIDAICINQTDIEERNFQVKRMRDIYSRASGAIVWLGNAANDSDKAMDMIESVANRFFTTREEMMAYMASLRSKPALPSGSWTALSKLLSRPYWTRLWVIQEIALSQDSLNIRLKTKGLGEFQTAFNRIQQLASFRNVIVEGQKLVELKQVVTISRGSEQFNPRDKVYGILGLVDEKLAKLVEPDYTLETSKVFMDFAKAAIESSGSLDVVTWQGIPTLERKLPSWVLDLTEDLAVSLEMTMKVPYHASRDSKALVSFRDGKLIARGFRIDEVDGLGAVYGESEGEGTLLQPVQTNSPYEGNAQVRDALWRTLLADRIGAGDLVPESYARILDVPWEDDEEDPDAESAFHAVLNDIRCTNADLRLSGQDFRSYFTNKTDEGFAMQEWEVDPFQRIWGFNSGRRLFVTKKGYLGQARQLTQRGDVVCILLGCSVPAILRPRTDDQSYQVVGESYIHGFMNGEAMDILDEGKYSSKDLCIC